MNKSLIHRLYSLLRRAEDYLLVTAVLLTIVLASLQILMRNLFDSGILWADSALRVLILWLGMLGAMYASREDKHIRIDLVSRYLGSSSRKLTWYITELFAALVCAIACWYSLVFVSYEYSDGALAFAAIPSWLTASIIPFAFAVMALRYLLSILLGYQDKSA